jgi:hypothetical protein
MRAANASERTIFMTSASSRSTLAAGRPAGATIATHGTMSKPSKPASATVGRSGSNPTRSAELTAIAWSLPALR